MNALEQKEGDMNTILTEHVPALKAINNALDLLIFKTIPGREDTKGKLTRIC